VFETQLQLAGPLTGQASAAGSGNPGLAAAVMTQLVAAKVRLQIESALAAVDEG
jgi:hypothetical protein